MSQFPNSAAAPLDPFATPSKPRVSIMAIVSLVFGLLCCIPGVGLIASLLGGISLVRISQSEGRLTGRGLAFVGLLGGLLGTIFYIVVAMSALASTAQMNQYGLAIQNAQNGNPAAIRGVLSASTSASVSDEEIQKFAAAVTAEVGLFQRMPKGLGGWIRDLVDTQKFNPRMQPGQPMRVDIGAVPMHFERGLVVVGLYLDTSSQGSGGAVLRNIGIHTRDGKAIYLRPEPASTPAAAPSTTPGTPTPGAPAPATPAPESGAPPKF